jgi:predicted ABC-type ATPase
LAYLTARGYALRDAPPELELEAFLHSANAIEEEALSAVRAGRRLGVETVLSTLKYIPLVEEVRRRAGQFHLIYIALRSHALSAERVALRVRKGGHNVPFDRLEHRWERSLANLPVFAALATTFYVFDNSRHGPHPILVAYGGRETSSGVLRGDICAPEAIPEVTLALATLFGAA